MLTCVFHDEGIGGNGVNDATECIEGVLCWMKFGSQRIIDSGCEDGFYQLERYLKEGDRSYVKLVSWVHYGTNAFCLLDEPDIKFFSEFSGIFVYDALVDEREDVFHLC